MEWCAVMCQVMCVWAQRAETGLIILMLGKECVQGRSPACMCVCSPLSALLVCVSLALSVFLVISYICIMSSQRSRAECVYNCAGICIHLCRE